MGAGTALASSDPELVRRARAGDTAAFGELVARYQRSALATARHLTGDIEAAKDATQEAFIEAYRNLSSLDDPRRFSQWLYGILRNRCRRYLRGRRPPPAEVDVDRIPDPASTPVADSGPSPIDLLDRLPSATRELLTARYVHDMSYAEMARAFGTTVGTVRVKCCHARRELREAFAAAEGGAT
jgi:RNA polymerase sigma-70 factor (ECF subfamily)